jgi:coenzyme Q-binding protein COQ10
VTTHRESRIVPYTADLMFQVVADVEAYPKFLPWVTGTRVLARTGNTLDAEMSVGFARFTESYVSRVTLDPAARAISVVQTRGPFRVLTNDWRFTPEGQGCRIDFEIVFAFRNPVLNMVAGAAFERVSKRMAEAFENRARALSRGA